MDFSSPDSKLVSGLPLLSRDTRKKKQTKKQKKTINNGGRGLCTHVQVKRRRKDGNDDIAKKVPSVTKNFFGSISGFFVLHHLLPPQRKMFLAAMGVALLAGWACGQAALEVVGDCGLVDLRGAWQATNANGSVVVPATVPGQIHLDLLRAGIIKARKRKKNKKRRKKNKK
jgi:hypothetical protein